MMMLESLAQDLRFACRGLWRSKAFTGTAVLTLALGVAGTTVMFALIQGVLLRPLPVHEQERLIVAWKEVRTWNLQLTESYGGARVRIPLSPPSAFARI